MNVTVFRYTFYGEVSTGHVPELLASALCACVCVYQCLLHAIDAYFTGSYLWLG